MLPKTSRVNKIKLTEYVHHEDRFCDTTSQSSGIQLRGVNTLDKCFPH